MKVFTSQQIREADRYTIENEPIASIDLMERASAQCVKWISSQYSTKRKVAVFAGSGNNGGDGLAIARMLANNGYTVYAFVLKISDNFSSDWRINLKRLEDLGKVKIIFITDLCDMPELSNNILIVDALFGTGLSRMVSGIYAQIIDIINSYNCEIIAIDLPSGLFGEDNTEIHAQNTIPHVIKAKYTLTFEFPKLAFFFSHNYQFIGKWIVLPISIHRDYIDNTSSPFRLLDISDIAPLIKKRPVFSHKGTFGHGLIIAGSNGMFGAAILATQACLRSGVGLVTIHTAASGSTILHISVPEAIVSSDESIDVISNIPPLQKYSAIGVGPGIGTDERTAIALNNILHSTRIPLVIDADAINILSKNKHWKEDLPTNSILTPHPGEFERLISKKTEGYERLVNQLSFAQKYKVWVILKGAYTTIAGPAGECYINSTGNPGMATAGSGDVLTGIIVSLLAQGYTAQEASLISVYLHGLAGDLASEKQGQEALIASDIIAALGKAFFKLKSSEVKNLLKH